MNRRDSSTRGQQPGGYQGDEGRWDVPRQAGQWQDGPSRQAGGFRDQDDNNRPAPPDPEGRYIPDPRTDIDDGGFASRLGPDYPYPSDPRAAYGRGDQRPRDVEYPIHNFDGASGDTFSSFTSGDYGGHDNYVRHGGVGGGFGGGMHPSNSYRPTFGFSRDDYGDWREYGERRGFLKRAGDEIASWFGNEEAAHRRHVDHRGRGPSDFTRSDERIREDVHDSLTNDWRVDASRVRVTVADGEVTLDGTVDSRAEKRRAEDLTDDVSGVRHVQNNLRVGPGTIGSGSAFSDPDGTL
ncbi:BON domain-containing protein [Novosphingobium sp. PhB165]|uniref:BON domain-containing protein n=1 Tax=Novosphingobium sp. PhB165 TaxID=2485105 RepID=UPI0010524A90|nr:BON domain-containing protein [Novosphingobium sp. PhB165]TCM20624.1 BON domain-containing protein [Novosphingobium sp. PhB165]